MSATAFVATSPLADALQRFLAYKRAAGVSLSRRGRELARAGPLLGHPCVHA